VAGPGRDRRQARDARLDGVPGAAPLRACQYWLASTWPPGSPSANSPPRRYEHPTPGDLVHADVKKLGRIPDSGGWRTVGRLAG
jgi:hypothetical protein